MTQENDASFETPRAPRQPRRALASRAADYARAMFSTSLDAGPKRIRLVALGFLAIYAVIGGKLAYLGSKPDPANLRRAAAEAVAAARPDILDRNGEILATDVKVKSIFAEPKRLVDKDEACELLTAALPIDQKNLCDRLASKKGFVWVKREVTQHQSDEVFHLGLPGVGLITENKRVYPNGPIGAHVLGFADLDNKGVAGIEKYIDGQDLSVLSGAGFSLTPENLKPITLSLDIKATHALRDEVLKGIEEFKAKAGAAAIMDVNTGEVIAMASLPDYDPNTPPDVRDVNLIDRLIVGTYEMGSTFKALTIAMAIDSGKVNLNTRIDARSSLTLGRSTIPDFHAQHRMLTVPEVFTYSSNVGTARMALGQGVEKHRAFLRKMGQLTRMRTELPEGAEPQWPRKNWSEISTATIAFGHGIAVAPMQAMMGVAALMNGGYLMAPTFLKRNAEDAKRTAAQVIKTETSEAMRYLMRLNAEVGTAKKADVAGYFVGGKTGTAEKVFHRHYVKNRLFTTFMAVVPADKPKYLFMTVMDEPQGLPKDGGYATAAYNSGVVTGRLIERVAPLLGLPPRFDTPPQPFPLLAKAGFGFVNTPSVASGGH
jgi:cell division protein FtsI (penicillin-binding protein 3)